MEAEVLLPTVIAAYNPIVIQATQSSEGEESGEGVLQINIGDTQITKKKEYFDGKAIFDLSKLLQKFFKDEVVEELDSINIGINKAFIDKNLFVKFSTEVIVSDDGWDISEKCAINAIVQLGKSSSKSNLIGKILNSFSVLKLYDGYPQNVYGLTPDDTVEENSEFRFVTTDSWFNAEISQKLVVISSPLIFDDQFLPVSVEFWNGGLKTDSRDVVEECTPDHPFYVRWINNNGGRDSWMFTKRNQQKKSEITETFQPQVQDLESAGTFEQAIDGNGSKAIIAGCGHITREDYEVLSDIVYSPKIEWYNEELQKWIQVKLDNPFLEKDYDAERADIELKFILPEIQMQY